MTCLHTTSDYTFVAETPEMHDSPQISAFITQEIHRPSKQWIMNILNGKQEQEEVRFCNNEFILLPDTERVNRYPLQPLNTARPYKRVLNWLAIAQDTSLHTLRDLRGRHTDTLRAMHSICTQLIQNETGFRADQIMAYIHYPPSVYQLHIHFSFPYGQYCHRDTYRVHSLQTIINNLQIDSEYYAKATLQIPVHRQSFHYLALTESKRKAGDEGDAAPSPLPDKTDG